MLINTDADAVVSAIALPVLSYRQAKIAPWRLKLGIVKVEGQGHKLSSTMEYRIWRTCIQNMNAVSLRA